MEMIPAEKQPMIDRYYEKGDNEKEIVDYLEQGWSQREGSAQQYFNIIKSAKENGIKVYGIDEPAEVDLKSDRADRLTRSNPEWASVITKNTKAGDKYIIFGGYGHSANYLYNKGVDQLLGDIPSVDFDTSDSGKTEIIGGDGKANDFQVLLPKSPNQPKGIF